MCNAVECQLERGELSDTSDGMMKVQLQMLKNSRAALNIDLKMLNLMLNGAKRQASNRRDSHDIIAGRVCNDACSEHSDWETSVLTPAVSTGSPSINSQTTQALEADGESKDQLLPPSVSTPQSDSKTKHHQESSRLGRATSVGVNMVKLTAVDWTKSDKNNALQQTILNICGTDIKERLTKTASLYLAFELIVSMPFGVSTPAGLACMMCTFAVITWSRRRELTRLKEGMLPGKEELWTRQEINVLEAWVFVAMVVGFAGVRSVPYFQG